jgi:hypothetical protein
MGTGMETLVIGNCILAKSEQKAELARDYAKGLEAD